MEQNDISRIMDLSDPDVLADNSEEQFQNVFRRHIKDNPKKELIARHKIWLSTIQHEYPMPYIPYRIGVYIRYHNQTKHDNYIELQKLQRHEDIALCPAWTLVDFYIDNGARAPRMENSKEWCRLLEDCFSGKVDLIVTQTVKSVSRNPDELLFIARTLAAQKHPVGIYFISEDIFTLASYYRQDLHEKNLLPSGWDILPKDELDGPFQRKNPEAFLPGEDLNSGIALEES